MNEIILTIAIFAGLQLINVILNTLKTLIMAKTDNKHASAVINAVTFGFYTAVVQQIGHLPLEYTIPVTMVTNVIGVYLTYWIMGKFRKDNLWKIEVFHPKSINLIAGNLDIDNIPYVKVNDQIITIYAYTQEHSALAKLYIDHIGAKYNITEITKKF